MVTTERLHHGLLLGGKFLGADHLLYCFNDGSGSFARDEMPNAAQHLTFIGPLWALPCGGSTRRTSGADVMAPSGCSQSTFRNNSIDLFEEQVPSHVSVALCISCLP